MSGRLVTVRDAAMNLLRLVEYVEKGGEVVIVRGHEPIARLVPVARREGGRRFGTLRGQVKMGASFFDPMPDDEEIAGPRGEVEQA